MTNKWILKRLLTSLLTGMIALLLINACALQPDVYNTNAQPLWLSGDDSKYPNKAFLTATGSAANQESARERALGNLAKIFKVNIQQVSVSREQVAVSKQNGSASVVHEQQLNSTVNTSTSQLLEGVRIAEQWYNPTDLTYHALAVLDRAQARKNLRREINRLDEETASLLKLKQQRSSQLLAILDLNQAIRLQTNRQALQKQMGIIDLRGNAMPEQWRLSELKAQLRSALRAMPLQLDVTEDSTGGLRETLQAVAVKTGLSPGDSGYRLVGAMQSAPIIEQDGWYWQRGTLSVRLVSQQGDVVLGQKQWPLKVSAQSKATLNARMQSAINKTLDAEFAASFMQFLEGN